MLWVLGPIDWQNLSSALSTVEGLYLQSKGHGPAQNLAFITGLATTELAARSSRLKRFPLDHPKQTRPRPHINLVANPRGAHSQELKFVNLCNFDIQSDIGQELTQLSGC